MVAKREADISLNNITPTFLSNLGTCGPADKVLDSRSKGLRFNSHCWSYVQVLGKLLIPHLLCLASSDRYLVDKKKYLSAYSYLHAMRTLFS